MGKPYFRFGPQVEKANKSTQEYLWKEVVIIKTQMIVIISIIVINDQSNVCDKDNSSNMKVTNE